MFKLIRSIFSKDQQGGYPESLIKEAIERTVDGTDQCLRAVSGYQKKLRPAVIRAIDHVVAMVTALPPPVPVRFTDSKEERCLKGYFISAKEMHEVFSRDRVLAKYLQGLDSDPPEVVALLAMEKQERVAFGAALSGDIVIRDVPMVTVGFDGHRLVDPTADERSTRRALAYRAFDHLLGLALKRLAFAKSERSDLERHHSLLQAKLNLFAREGLGFDPAAGNGRASQAELEEQLAQIERQLKELGGDASEFESYLQIVAEVMGNPEQYFEAKNETIFVNQLGIKQQEAASDVQELSFCELRNAEGRSLVVMLVTLETAELRGLTAVTGS